MNPLTLFLYVLLVIGPSQALSQVETILAADTHETIDAQVVTTLKDQLQERLDRSAFQPAAVAISEVSGQLVVTATVDTEDEEALAAYRSLFVSTSLGLWNTYRVDDDEILEWIQGIGPIEGFQFNAVAVREISMFDQQVELRSNGGRDIHMAALGIGTREEDKQRILDSLMLQAHSLPDLILLWSSLTVDRYTQEAYYVLFMIKTDGNETARLTEAHAASIQAERSLWTDEPEVRIQFNEEGTAIWADLTKTAAGNGQSIAIVINNVVHSAPGVMGEIPTGEMTISKDFSMEEARDLARKLALGRLAYPLAVVSERVLKDEEQ